MPPTQRIPQPVHAKPICVISCVLNSLAFAIANARPSKVLRAYIRTLWYAYKLPFYATIVVSLPEILAFGLLFVLFAGLLYLYTDFVAAPLLLPAALRARRCFGASGRAIDASLEHVKNMFSQGAWLWYLLFPSIATLGAIFFPLSMRLLLGQGYGAALLETWEDRHLAAYVGGVEDRLDAWGVAAWWANLVSLVV